MCSALHRCSFLSKLLLQQKWALFVVAIFKFHSAEVEKGKQKKRITVKYKISVDIRCTKFAEFPMKHYSKKYVYRELVELQSFYLYTSIRTDLFYKT